VERRERRATRKAREGLRAAHLHRARRQAAEPAGALPRSHHSHLQQARHEERRLLDAAGRANKDNTLVYIISHDSREQAKKNWADFQADPEWKKVSAESQVDGPIVTKVVSVFMDATDYSPIK
jgi:hypothetical protein